jgi:hypothetical protein
VDLRTRESLLALEIIPFHMVAALYRSVWNRGSGQTFRFEEGGRHYFDIKFDIMLLTILTSFAKLQFGHSSYHSQTRKGTSDGKDPESRIQL